MEHSYPSQEWKVEGKDERSASPNRGDAARERATTCGGTLNRPRLCQSPTDIHKCMQSSKTEPPPFRRRDGKNRRDRRPCASPMEGETPRALPMEGGMPRALPMEGEMPRALPMEGEMSRVPDPWRGRCRAQQSLSGRHAPFHHGGDPAKEGTGIDM